MSSMRRKILRAVALSGFAVVVLLGAAWRAQAQDAKTPYPKMAPVEQYMMERSAEIALALTAIAHVSAFATFDPR